MNKPTRNNAPPAWRPWSRAAFEARRAAGRREAYQPATACAAAVVAGIVLDRYTGIGSAGAVGAATALAVWAAAWRRGWRRVAAATLLLGIALTAAAGHHARWRVFSATDLGRYAPRHAQPICLEAVALGEPSLRVVGDADAMRAIPQIESTRLLVRPTSLRDGGAWRPVGGRCELLVDGHLVGVSAGDRLRVFGRLARFKPATNPGQFDAALHARAARTLCRVRAGSPDCVTPVRKGRWWAPPRLVGRVRSFAIRSLDRLLPPRQADLLAAMLLGARDRVAPEVDDLFRRTGAVHVLVVSGLHVGLVLLPGWFAMRMGWLPRRGAIAMMMVLAVGYAAIAGGRPPVVRAVVLAEVLCVAALLGRRVIAFNSLAAAAVVVLLINPCELFRTGTQLSFLATATLMWFGSRQIERRRDDPLDRLIASARPWWLRAATASCRGAGVMLTATLAVWVVSAPLLLMRFHLVSPVAVPASLVVFPLVAVAVTSGLGLIAFGWLGPGIASPLGFVAGGAVDALVATLRAADQLPGAYLWAPGGSWWWTLGFYLLVGAGVLVRRRPAASRLVFRAMLAWLPIAFTPLLTNGGAAPACRVTFLDVGHGSSVIVEAPSGEVLLYDAGSLGSPGHAADTVASALWRRGRTSIDAVFLSHADVDHYNALPGVLDRFRVGDVFVSPMMLPRSPIRRGDGSAPATLARLLDASGVAPRRLEAGDRLRFGGLGVEVLHPAGSSVAGSDNTNSLVLAIEFAGRRLLLPGDLEASGLETLLSQAPRRCDVLMAPHHGSSRSDPPGFAAWARPSHVVISGGQTSHDAGSSYAAAGAEVLRTSESGAISVVLPSEGVIQVKTFLGPPVP